ncbi:MAG: type II secretion system protein [Clostridium sp.]|nr:type II secretion system protein [Clostridium sp.]
MLRNKKGITLIALVVTIVVLLILAGVTISLLLDENGIITKSKDARNANRAGAIKEEITLWKADKFAADNGAGSHESMDDFLARLKTRGLISDEDIATIKDTRKLQVGKETIVFPSDAKTLVQAFKDNEIKVGDYLNYNDYVDETKTCTTLTNENGWADQKYTATKNTYWQVLGLDSTGEKLMLISQSPIKKEMKEEQTTGVIKNKIRLASIENAVKLGTETSGGESSGSTGTTETWETTPYLVLKGAYGYVNCKTILNNISGIYSTSLGTAESLTIEEINRLIGVTVDYTNKKVYANSDPSVNIDGYKVLGNQYTYKASDYTPESYINNKTNATAGKQTDPATAYSYQWGNLTIDDTLKTMLFSGTTSDANFAKSYWLASSGVRPVVYLNSEVTVEDLHVIDGQEDNWSAYSNGDTVASGGALNGEAGNPGNPGGGPS